MSPSAPAAIEATAIGATRLALPVPWLGSITTGKCVVWCKYGCQGQGEARVVFERADAAFTEHHALVAGLEDVFGGEQELVHGRRRSALEQHRQAAFADGFEERIVLHVASADLKDVRVLADEGNMLRGHHLGDDGEAGLVAG